MNFQIHEPAAKRTTLVKTAGFIWIAVGLFLIIRGLTTFLILDLYALFLTIFAIVIGYLKAKFIFYKIISNNIMRIKQLAPEKDKVCIFAFQAIQSYLIVLLMILLGWILKISPIETNILSFIYILIGIALLISSIKYFKSVKEFTPQEDNPYQIP
jgi:hypothetical protein